MKIRTSSALICSALLAGVLAFPLLSSAADTATDAAAAASASRTTSAASAAAATAASPRDQHAATDVFIVDEMEGGEADVGELFFSERRQLARREARPLLKVARRHG